LRALLPPPERRGCVLLDPPYEERADYSRVHDAVVDSLQRFPTAVLLAWLPVKLRGDFDLWFDALKRAVSRPLLASLLWMHPPDSRAALNGSAMVVVNPPYLIEEDMRDWLPELRALLAAATGTVESTGCEVQATSARG
jgi:23S rRNA (adenine2030-N6)-methyltransferase